MLGPDILWQLNISWPYIWSNDTFWLIFIKTLRFQNYSFSHFKAAMDFRSFMLLTHLLYFKSVKMLCCFLTTFLITLFKCFLITLIVNFVFPLLFTSNTHLYWETILKIQSNYFPITLKEFPWNFYIEHFLRCYKSFPFFMPYRKIHNNISINTLKLLNFYLNRKRDFVCGKIIWKKDVIIFQCNFYTMLKLHMMFDNRNKRRSDFSKNT